MEHFIPGHIILLIQHKWEGHQNVQGQTVIFKKGIEADHRDIAVALVIFD